MKLRLGRWQSAAEKVDLCAAIAMIEPLAKHGVIVRALQPCRDYLGYELLIQRGSRTPDVPQLRGPALRLVVSNGVVALAGTESDGGEFWFLGEAIRDARECCQAGFTEVASWQLWQLVERGHPELAKNRWRPLNRHAAAGSASHLVRLKRRSRFTRRSAELGERVHVGPGGIAGMPPMDLINNSGAAYIRRDDLITFIADRNVTVDEHDGAAMLRFVLRCIADYLQSWEGEPAPAYALVALRARILNKPDGMYVRLDDIASWITKCTEEPLPASLALDLEIVAASLAGLGRRWQ